MKNLRKLSILDGEENVLYELKATQEIINRANEDMRFATILLQLCKDEGCLVFDQPIAAYSDVRDKENLFNSNASTSSSTSSMADNIFEKSGKSKKSAGKTKINNDAIKKNTDVKNWTNREVLLLFAAYKEYQLEFSDLNIIKVWTKITENVHSALAEQNLPTIGKEKCITKWDTLKRRYKRLKDNSKQSGSAPITWIFYDEIEEVFGEQPWVKPLSTAGSNTINKMDPEIIIPPQKRQKTLTNFCEELLTTKKENSDIRKQHHREKIASIGQLTDAVNKLVDCVTKGHEAS